MLELAGENPFKVRAYENGAKALFAFSGDFPAAVASRELLKTPGIGAGLFANIETLVRTGSLPYYDELRARFPPGLRECLRIPGLGARKVRELHEALGVDSLEALAQACREGKLAAVRGFGPRSVEKILKGIALVRSSAGFYRHRPARHVAEEVLAFLAQTGSASSLAIAGSLRRASEIVRNIDLVAASSEPERLAEAFRNIPGVAGSAAEGPASFSVRLPDGLTARLRVVPAEEFAAALLVFTGSDEHVGELQERAKALGLALSERGLFRATVGARLPAGSEAEIYAALGLGYVEPELREGRGEIEASRRGELPTLVSERDLRGLIHVHTTWSDGRDSLEAMVAAARDAGYSYAAITDHSKSAGYAGGLDEERVLAQREEIHPRRRIDRLRRRVPAGLRPRRGVHTLALRPLPGTADGAARARGPQSPGLGARAPDRPAAPLPRRDRRGPRRGHRRGGGIGLRPGNQLLAPEAGPGLAVLPERGRQGGAAGDRPRRALRRRARPHPPRRRDRPQGLGHAGRDAEREVRGRADGVARETEGRPAAALDF